MCEGTVDLPTNSADKEYKHQIHVWHKIEICWQKFDILHSTATWLSVSKNHNWK